MRGVRAEFIRTFQKVSLFREENDLKLLILEKVPFIKPFDHFLISRKQYFNANFRFFGNISRNFEKLHF